MSRKLRHEHSPVVHQDKKSWTIHDLVAVKPVTDRQSEAVDNYYDGHNLALLGSAGTGKTFLATYLAMRSLMEKEVEKVMFFRSTVQSRDMGFLPGEIEEKYAPFEQPYHDALAQLFRRASTYEEMKKRGLVEFHPTAFLRGLTCDNAIMILDEAQNMTFQEIDTVLTRVGKNSTVIIIGDTRQDDLKSKRETSGLAEFARIASGSDLFKTTMFKPEDCVRSGFVKDWLMLKEQQG